MKAASKTPEGSSTESEKAVIEKLANEINAALAAPISKVRLADIGVTPMPMTPRLR